MFCIPWKSDGKRELAPIIILATNRGITRIRGTDVESPHGMPLDLLDRLLIIRTKPYTKDEIREILKIRSKATKIKLTKEALEKLTEIGVETSLRYAVQLMEPAWERARVLKRDYVDVEDIEYVRKLFVDVKESSKYARDFEKQFLR